uniref:M_domain domain-containing protein n=1 Tax=Mesocestoides corti TaxID=53468 RepID=A0A5K3FX94_MESCO
MRKQVSLLSGSNPAVLNQKQTSTTNRLASVTMMPQGKIQESVVETEKPQLRLDYSTIPPPKYQAPQFTEMQGLNVNASYTAPSTSYNSAMRPAESAGAALHQKPTPSTSSLAYAKATPNGNIEKCNVDMGKQQLQPDDNTMPLPMYQVPQVNGMQGFSGSYYQPAPATSCNFALGTDDLNWGALNQIPILTTCASFNYEMTPLDKIVELQLWNINQLWQQFQSKLAACTATLAALCNSPLHPETLSAEVLSLLNGSYPAVWNQRQLRPEDSTMPPPMYQVPQFTGMHGHNGSSCQPAPATSHNFAMGPGKCLSVFPNTLILIL